MDQENQTELDWVKEQCVLIKTIYKKYEQNIAKERLTLFGKLLINIEKRIKLIEKKQI